MIDKYLRNDTKFLIRKKKDDVVEKEYIKYLQSNHGNNEEINSLDGDEDVCSERNYIMREDDHKQIDTASKITPKEINSSKSKRNFFNEINELNDDDLFSDRKIEEKPTNQHGNSKQQLEYEYLDFENLYLNEGKIKKNIGSIESDLIQYDTNGTKISKKEAASKSDASKVNDKLQILLGNKQSQIENENDANNNNSNELNDYNSNDQLNNKSVDHKVKLTIQMPTLDSKENLFIRDINQNNSKIISHMSDNYDQLSAIKSYEKNDFKLKRLQEKIEEKLKQEYELKIRQREKEIELKTKREFEEAMNNLKDQLQDNLESEKKKLEMELHKKWEDKYQDLLVDCKAKLRDDKEQKLAANMYNKLRPAVEKEIYRKEYNKIEEKIRNELEERFNKDIQTKKFEEIEKAKRKLEYYTKQKISEMESNIKNKCKEEVESELKKDIERKEKEIKINYMRKFNSFKNNLEKQLKDEYESKKKELLKEINEIKSEVFRQKCAEKLKLSKISKIKKNLAEKEMIQLKNAEKLEMALQSQYHSQNNFGPSKSFYSDNIVNMDNHKMNNQEYLCEVDSFNEMPLGNQNLNKNSTPDLKIASTNKSKEKMSDVEANKNSRKILNNVDHQNYLNNKIRDETSRSKSRGKMSADEQNVKNSHTNNAVNIFEINKKFKSPLNLNSSENLISQSENKAELSLIIKDLNNTNNMNLKDSLKIMVNKNSKITLPRDDDVQEEARGRIKFRDRESKNKIQESSQRELNQSKKGNLLINSHNLQNNVDNTINLSPSSRFIQNINTTKQAQSVQNPILINCHSIRVFEKIPLTLIEFGKYLVKHIENEENYKILFEKEFKKIKVIINKNFERENLSDHCMFDYMLELWDKLEISYEKRYKIISELSKK